MLKIYFKDVFTIDPYTGMNDEIKEVKDPIYLRRMVNIFQIIDAEISLRLRSHTRD